MNASSPATSDQAHATAESVTPAAVDVHPADFPEMTDITCSTTDSPPPELSLGRFLDVTLQASVELGRAVLPIGDVLKLGPGSVVELDRELSDPVDVLVQGIRLARGEVVVVDNLYAVRITEIEAGPLGKIGAAGKLKPPFPSGV